MRYLLLISFTLLFLFGNPAFSQVQPDPEFNSLLRKYNGGWIAGDATFSISLPDQRTLWLFGDSFIGTVNPDSSIVAGSHFIRNCAVIQDGDSMRSLHGGTFSDPADFLPSSNPDSSWYWPEHGMVENDTLKIFFSEFEYSTGPPGFNFKYKSLCLAFFSYPEIEFLDLIPIPYYSQNKVSYGNCLMTDNGFTYIYGRQEIDTVYHIPYPHVARVPSGNLQAPWQFFNGSSWVDNPEESYRIGNVAVSQQFGFFKVEDKYVLISQEIWLSAKIYSYTCVSPGGPLNNKKLLYQTPILYPNTFTYNAFPHTQFTEDSELLVSYNTNGDFWQIFNNVEIYRPLFIRVPLSMIDPTFPTGIEQGRSTQPVRLFQNTPNPVDAFTQVNFQLDSRQHVRLDLTDIKGNKVSSFVNTELGPGLHTISMNLGSLGSGVYLYGIGQTQRKLIKN